MESVRYKENTDTFARRFWQVFLEEKNTLCKMTYDAFI
jgi:hypothetical protein